MTFVMFYINLFEYIISNCIEYFDIGNRFFCVVLFFITDKTSDDIIFYRFTIYALAPCHIVVTKNMMTYRLTKCAMK